MGYHRVDQADYARDSKKEEAMCAFGLCTTSHNLREGPKGWSGKYGGSMLCEDCYQKVADRLANSLRKHGCAPWEME